MTRKHLVEIGIIVLAAATISSLIAYRQGMRRSTARAIPSVAPTASEPCVNFTEAAPLVGNNGCVTGRVLKVFTSRAGNTFLDFCPDYRTCPFMSVIFSADKPKFGDLSTLSGRQVEIRGPVTTYRGRAEIVIHEPDQIQVVP